MTVNAYRERSPADWLFSQDEDWADLATLAPLGYERYARLRFVPDPEFLGQRESDVTVPDRGGPDPSEIWQMGAAAQVLARHTTTPDDCFYLIWEGWPKVAALSTGLGAAKIDLADDRGSVVRSYYLYRGDTDLIGWDDDDGEGLGPRLPMPAFVWPADRAWCMVRDVDPHFASIGASSAGIADLLDDLRIDVVEDEFPREPPWYA
ncbi:hypothetical protein ACIGKQ_22475 [Gordonia sp. NPDC062954]|uniref:hypothetical protein n=1 Tax=Gordonia sp. NPDC062954 TaxID=3364003 RepID=UPI0037CACE77